MGHLYQMRGNRKAAKAAFEKAYECAKPTWGRHHEVTERCKKAAAAL